METAILILVLLAIGTGIYFIRKQTRKVRQQMMDEMNEMD